ncbi:MAG: hypothetical protein LBI82_05080 [Dysgonamonadaceae bacterium]|jgi:hypothetical protein|nr:hypothetical protein [Dysgonamonadaceae bacterium]
MLHYFNPGHETAVLNASPHYTPAANQVKMQRDLAFLPAWYTGSSNDFVWIEDNLTADFVSSIEPLNHLAKPVSTNDILKKKHLLSGIEVSPWGISPQVLKFSKILSDHHELNLQLPQWKNEYSELCSRQTAKKGLEFIIKNQPEISNDIVPQFFTTIEDIENAVTSSRVELLAKAPYSSSGRGLLWLPPGNLHQSEKQIISGILKKQSFISIEKVLDKRTDFAMLFHSDGLGKVEFTGLSLFETNKKGVYDKNILISQDEIQSKLATCIDAVLLEKVKNTLIQFLNQTFGCVYKGCIGIDMMIYADSSLRGAKQRSNLLHPCVEINMRNTMGLLSFKLYQNFFYENSTGYFKIDFSNKPGELLQKHREMQQLYPVEFANGKIKSGYLSLCPIKDDSKYWAYIKV